MRNLLFLLTAILLSACGGYEVKNLAKSDTDLVADEFIAESRSLVLQLMVKLYKRNPDQLGKIPGMTVEGRLAQLQVNRRQLRFDELNGMEGIDAMNLAFKPAYRGDRVFALTVGLGGMLREAYGYKPELFIYDSLQPEALRVSARNVEVLLWKLKNNRKPDGSYFLISYKRNGVVDNLSFERLFGKLIVMQELMARIAGDADDRVITGTFHAVSRVFIPLPI
jgi:hypothetical protein